MKKFLLFNVFSYALVISSYAQGYISGDLELRNDYYLKDSVIGASGTNHYDNLKSSVDGWLSLNYTNNDWGFRTGIRLDMFLNSRFHNPNQDAYTAIGVGRWFIEKEIKGLTLTGGHFYDQFGSGLAFRAYENRFLGIDNAIFGLKAKYDFNKNWMAKAFAGVQKNRMGLYKKLIKGLNVEGNIPIGEKVLLSPGVAMVNRTLDKESMTQIANAINGYALEDRFVPRYNTYVFSAYNRLDAGNWSWYLEGAYKTHEALDVGVGLPYQDKPGNAVFTSLTYSKKGFGITAQFKRTDHFQFRTAPEDKATILNGAINFIPPVNKQNSLRLPARLQPPSQELEEVGFSVDMTKKINKHLTFNLNYSQIHNNDVTLGDFVNDMIYVRKDFNGLRNFDNTLLYKELYFDFEWRAGRKLKGLAGFQIVNYNQEFYEGDHPTYVYTYTPFAELTYKFSSKISLRTELQYQFSPAFTYNTTKEIYTLSEDEYDSNQDFWFTPKTRDGDWFYVLAELNISPKFSFSISDMWNVKTGNGKNVVSKYAATGKNTIIKNTGVHFFSFYGSYTHGPHRFYASYVRQVQGIVCTGGICRLEPAFNGFRFGLNTSF